MAEIIPSYTMCAITVHIKKEFQLQLVRPPQENVQRLKSQLSLNNCEIDKDDDLEASGGRWSQLPEVVIREVKGYLSRQTIRIVLLRGTTSDCFTTLYHILATLYGVSTDAIKAGIEYVVYQTGTKAKFSGPLYNIFCEPMQKTIAEWTDLSSGALIHPVSNGEWSAPKGLIDIDEGQFQVLYKGQPSAIVMPSVIAFSLWVPSKFSKMTNYSVRIAPASVEDFHQDLYFVETEFPYETHAKLVEAIESM